LLGATSASITALVDAMTVGLSLWSAEAIDALMFAPLAALGLTTASLSLVSLLQAPLLGIASGVFHHRSRKEGDDSDGSRIVWTLVAALFAAIAASMAARQLMLRTDGFQVRAFAVAVVSLGAGLAALGGAGLGLGLRKLVRGLWPFRTNSRRALALLLAIVGGALIAVCRVLLVAYDVYLASLSAVVWLGLFFAIELLVGALLLGLPRRGYARLVARSKNRWLAVFALLVPTLGLVVGALLLDAHPPSAQRLAATNGISGFAQRALQAGTDFDGDGASAFFGQGDCAPFDARIGPRSFEIPGNGIDENCDGRDAEASAMAWRNDDPHYRAVPSTAVSNYNVIMVCFDTVRVDHLGFYGHENDTSPYLDSLATESWVFENAVAPSATTRMSLAAIFSGRYSSGVVWTDGARVEDVSEDNVFLAEILDDAGYQTFGVVDEWLPRFVPTMRQGFSKYESAYRVGTWRESGHRAGPFIAAKALTMMVGRDLAKPYFLYLHYEAPHHPYQHHPEVREFGQGVTDGYDSEIAYADHHLGLLMSIFEAEGWLENTVLVFFSDHGEEFREHGQSYHSRALYEESLRVPLLVHVPGQAPGRFDGRVSLIDILPTLLDLTGHADENLSLHGRSLLHRTLGDDPGAERQILSELVVGAGRPDELTALYYEDHKLIWNVSTGEMELFDLDADPAERNALDDLDLRSSMHERLRSMRDSIGGD